VPDKPIFLIGNSMGALAAASVAPALKPSGLVLLSPGFDGYPDTFTLSFRVKAILKALLSPTSEVRLPYESDSITRSDSARSWIDNDPERRYAVPAGMLLELLKLTESLGKQYEQITCPVLMLTAGHERIVNNPVSQGAYKRFASRSKQHRHFSEAWHDLMFDPELDEVTDEVVQWMSVCQPEKIAST